MEYPSAIAYPGSGLDLDDSFRLVQLQAGKDDDAIIIHLSAVRLSNSPPFEALSYVWGDPNETVSIKVIAVGAVEEFFDIPITINCHAALKRLRKNDGTRSLWIDAVCINQHLIPEKNHQLNLISRIYAQATRVVIYLGETADNSETALDWIREIDRPSDFNERAQWDHELKVIKPDTENIEKLLARQWFSRIWVLQEVRFAKAATVVCGNKEVDWDNFKAFSHWNTNQKWVKALPYVVQWSVMKIDISYNRELFLTSYPKRLLKKLKHTRKIDATDPRDKLFAILPLLDWEEDRFKEKKRKQAETANLIDSNAKEDEEDTSKSEGTEKPDRFEDEPEVNGRQNRRGIVVPQDYNLPTAQIFTQLARALIDELGLEILQEVLPTNKVPGLASWVPDWSANPKHSFLGQSRRAERGLYSSSQFSDQEWSKSVLKPLTKKWHFSDYTPSPHGAGTPSTQLHVRAVHLGTITKIGDMANIYDNYLPLKQWKDLLRDEHPWLLKGSKWRAPEPGTSWDERHKCEVETLSPFYRALAGDVIIYVSAIEHAIKRIREFNDGTLVTDEDNVQNEGNSNGNLVKGKEGGKLPLKDVLRGMGVSYEDQAEAIFYTVHGKRFFVTDNGEIGFVSEGVDVGDQIVIIDGANAHFVVKPIKDDVDGVKVVKLIQKCFVHGFNNIRGKTVLEKDVCADAMEMIIR
jgi:hypothetical protein